MLVHKGVSVEAYRELPEQCRAWNGFLFGSRAFATAEECPDEWIPVFELTVGELLVVLFGGQLSVLNHRPFAIRFDSVSRRFLAYPLYLMPESAGLPKMPEAWRDVIGPSLRWAVRPARTALLRSGTLIADASDILARVAIRLTGAVRQRPKGGRRGRVQVRAA